MKKFINKNMRSLKNPKNNSFLRFFKSNLGSARPNISCGIAGDIGACRTNELAKKIPNFSASSIAFTLGEIMIVFFVIGIVAAVTTISINSMVTKTKNNYLATSALLMLKQTVGNIIADDADAILAPTTANQKTLCSLIAKYANTVGVTDCTTAKGTNFSLSPNIRLSNGMGIYIVGASMYTTENWYYIYVNLDGDSGKNQTDDDVMEFIIKTDGTVLPNRVAASDTNYIAAVIKGNDSTATSGTKGGVIVPISGKKILPYVQAACSSGFITSTHYCSSYSVTAPCSDKTYSSCWPEIVMPKGLKSNIN